MKIDPYKKKTNLKVIIRKCHHCGHITESTNEPKKCSGCHKSFLPLNYFGKVHAKNSTEYYELFCSSDEINEEDLIAGIYAPW